jgi:hypothetical protein
MDLFEINTARAEVERRNWANTAPLTAWAASAEILAAMPLTQSCAGHLLLRCTHALTSGGRTLRAVTIQIETQQNGLQQSSTRAFVPGSEFMIA